ncbi:MAG: imidazole glycerol phosphate synthase subunit HisH [Chloroflexota bacterium]|nr:imidazole glycerol phosphate synthase subunit HisH [Chloroflexota bacterium]
MIAIVDYRAGNLRSVSQALAKLGYPARITSDPQQVLQAEAIILPGVGAGADAMESLRSLGLVPALRRAIDQGRPFFGVCLGLQVLFDETEEGEGSSCLGIVPGRVRRLPSGLKVPHMGWTQVHQKKAHPLFQGVPDQANFYFVHSYYPDPEDRSLVAGETDYGIIFGSVIIRDNLVATQFHPEKSGDLGLQLYDNFFKHHGVRKA